MEEKAPLQRAARKNIWTLQAKEILDWLSVKNLFLEKELNLAVAFKEFKVFILNETRSALPHNCRRVRVQPAKLLRDNRSSFAKMLFNYQNQLSHSELFEVRRTPSTGFGVLAKTNLTVEQGIVFCKEELIGSIKVFEDKLFEKLANDVHYPSLFSDRNVKGVSIGFLSCWIIHASAHYRFIKMIWNDINNFH